jgi:hypothetical protein
MVSGQAKSNDLHTLFGISSDRERRPVAERRSENDVAVAAGKSFVRPGSNMGGPCGRGDRFST